MAGGERVGAVGVVGQGVVEEKVEIQPVVGREVGDHDARADRPGRGEEQGVGPSAQGDLVGPARRIHHHLVIARAADQAGRRQAARDQPVVAVAAVEASPNWSASSCSARPRAGRSRPRRRARRRRRNGRRSGWRRVAGQPVSADRTREVLHPAHRSSTAPEATVWAVVVRRSMVTPTRAQRHSSGCRPRPRRSGRRSPFRRSPTSPSSPSLMRLVPFPEHQVADEAARRSRRSCCRRRRTGCRRPMEPVLRISLATEPTATSPIIIPGVDDPRLVVRWQRR